MSSFTFPVGRDPTDDEVDAFMEMMEGHDWFSDYDYGVSIAIDGETHRAGPGQTVTVVDGNVTITGVEVPMHEWESKDD